MNMYIINSCYAIKAMCYMTLWIYKCYNLESISLLTILLFGLDCQILIIIAFYNMINVKSVLGHPVYKHTSHFHIFEILFPRLKHYFD